MTNHTATIIIPARYAATRFPAKLVQDLCGKSIIQRTWEAACTSGVDRVVIATDHQAIATLAQSFGAQVVMTKAHHSGSDRVCEAARLLKLGRDDLVINLQGDEPLFSSRDIRRLVESMQQNPAITMASMMHPITDSALLDNPNCVKVVVDNSNRALYFSRAGIPHPRNQVPHTWMMHQGIYGFRMHTLTQFVALKPGPLEQIESLEQLRALYHGIAIQMIESRDPAHPGIDTPQDLQGAITTLTTTGKDAASP